MPCPWHTSLCALPVTHLSLHPTRDTPLSAHLCLYPVCDTSLSVLCLWHISVRTLWHISVRTLWHLSVLCLWHIYVPCPWHTSRWLLTAGPASVSVSQVQGEDPRATHGAAERRPLSARALPEVWSLSAHHPPQRRPGLCLPERQQGVLQEGLHSVSRRVAATRHTHTPSSVSASDSSFFSSSSSPSSSSFSSLPSPSPPLSSSLPPPSPPPLSSSLPPSPPPLSSSLLPPLFLIPLTAIGLTWSERLIGCHKSVTYLLFPPAFDRY